MDSWLVDRSGTVDAWFVFRTRDCTWDKRGRSAYFRRCHHLQSEPLRHWPNEDIVHRQTLLKRWWKIPLSWIISELNELPWLGSKKWAYFEKYTVLIDKSWHLRGNYSYPTKLFNLIRISLLLSGLNWHPWTESIQFSILWRMASPHQIRYITNRNNRTNLQHLRHNDMDEHVSPWAS